MMASQVDIVPYLLVMGCQPLLPSVAITGLPLLPEQPTLDKEEAYITKISPQIYSSKGLGVAASYRLSEEYSTLPSETREPR